MNIIKKQIKALINKRQNKKTKEVLESTSDLDYEKNIKKLKIKLNIRLLGGMIGTLIILLLVFTTMSIRHMENSLKEDFLGRLEHSREERKKSIEDYYLQIELEMKTEIRYNLTSKNFEVENFAKYKKLGVEEVALFSSDYKVIYQSEERDLIEIKKEIKALKFSKPMYVEKIKVSEDITSQNVFYKKFFPGEGEKVLYFKLSNRALNKILKVSPFKADILNDEFYITASNRVRESTEYTIDEISKKILDGRVGVDVFEGNIYSYTYIDIGENPLYLKIYESIDVYETSLNRYKNKIKLLWIISLVISLCNIYFLNISVDSYVKGIVRINIEKEGDKKYKFLKKELVEVFEDLNDVDRILDELNLFTQKLKIIGRRVKRQNKETLEKNREKEELIRKIHNNEEFRKELGIKSEEIEK